MIKEYVVNKADFENAGKASSDIKRTLKTLGLSKKVLKAVAIACYEAEINICIHSDGGTITFELDDMGVIHLTFKDIGPGIEDIEKALQPGYSTASKQARELGFGAGMGLYNMKSVANTFDIESSPTGTILTMTFYE